jgi:hypothetical protein
MSGMDGGEFEVVAEAEDEVSAQTDVLNSLCTTYVIKDVVEISDPPPVAVTKVHDPHDRCDSIAYIHGAGDINSNTKGSGARYNAGKPDYSLMMLDHLANVADESGSLEGFLDDPEELVHAMRALGMFQCRGQYDDLMEAFAYMRQVAENHKEEGDRYVLDPVIRVWEYGAEKYKMWNWAKGMQWSIPIGCIARHFLDICERDEYRDRESGEPHWAHIICNIQMLEYFYYHYPEGNDLPHKFLA